MSLSRKIIPALLLTFVVSAPALANDSRVMQQDLPQESTPVSTMSMYEHTLPAATTVKVGPATNVNVDGELVSMRQLKSLDQGIMVPDGSGGMVRQQIMIPAPAPEHLAARELKLKMRELADQLLRNIDPTILQGVSAMPVSFVNQDNFEESSSFGRYISEALFYEFNQRGFPVREYRNEGELATRAGQGEFYLSRRQQRVYAQSPLNLFLTGTYYYDRHNVFVNARLVRAGDGLVLRTGQLVFAQTPVTKRMLANVGTRLDSSYVNMQDYTTMTRATDLSPIDLGDDLH